MLNDDQIKESFTHKAVFRPSLDISRRKFSKLEERFKQVRFYDFHKCERRSVSLYEYALFTANSLRWMLRLLHPAFGFSILITEHCQKLVKHYLKDSRTAEIAETNRKTRQPQINMKGFIGYMRSVLRKRKGFTGHDFSKSELSRAEMLLEVLEVNVTKIQGNHDRRLAIPAMFCIDSWVVNVLEEQYSSGELIQLHQSRDILYAVDHLKASTSAGYSRVHRKTGLRRLNPELILKEFTRIGERNQLYSTVNIRHDIHGFIDINWLVTYLLRPGIDSSIGEIIQIFFRFSGRSKILSKPKGFSFDQEHFDSESNKFDEVRNRLNSGLDAWCPPSMLEAHNKALRRREADPNHPLSKQRTYYEIVQSMIDQREEERKISLTPAGTVSEAKQKERHVYGESQNRNSSGISLQKTRSEWIKQTAINNLARPMHRRNLVVTSNNGVPPSMTGEFLYRLAVYPNHYNNSQVLKDLFVRGGKPILDSIHNPWNEPIDEEAYHKLPQPYLAYVPGDADSFDLNHNLVLKATDFTVRLMKVECNIRGVKHRKGQLTNLEAISYCISEFIFPLNTGISLEHREKEIKELLESQKYDNKYIRLLILNYEMMLVATSINISGHLLTKDSNDKNNKILNLYCNDIVCDRYNKHVKSFCICNTLDTGSLATNGDDHVKIGRIFRNGRLIYDGRYELHLTNECITIISGIKWKFDRPDWNVHTRSSFTYSSLVFSPKYNKAGKCIAFNVNRTMPALSHLSIYDERPFNRDKENLPYYYANKRLNIATGLSSISIANMSKFMWERSTLIICLIYSMIMNPHISVAIPIVGSSGMTSDFKQSWNGIIKVPTKLEAKSIPDYSILNKSHNLIYNMNKVKTEQGEKALRNYVFELMDEERRLASREGTAKTSFLFEIEEDKAFIKSEEYKLDIERKENLIFSLFGDHMTYSPISLISDAIRDFIKGKISPLRFHKLIGICLHLSKEQNERYNVSLSRVREESGRSSGTSAELIELSKITPQEWRSMSRAMHDACGYSSEFNGGMKPNIAQQEQCYQDNLRLLRITSESRFRTLEMFQRLNKRYSKHTVKQA
jgi:hypothetical protein